jgi:hypothetical protein
MFVHVSKHAKERALDRYGFAGSDDDWTKAFLDITDHVLGLANNAMLLRKPDHRGAEVWLVRIRRVAMIAVYQPASAAFLTVLDPSWKMSSLI